VLDLATCRDITFTVPWCQSEPYKRNSITEAEADLAVAPGFENTTVPDASVVTRFNNISDYVNGYLSFNVVNELKSPNIDDTIQIMVFVKAGEDFEVAVPTGEQFRTLGPFVPQCGEKDSEESSIKIVVRGITTLVGAILAGVSDTAEDEIEFADLFMSERSFQPQAGEVTDALDQGDEENAPETDECCDFIDQPIERTVDLKPSVFFGEKVVSFRALLKRYMLYATHNKCDASPGTSTAASIIFQVKQGPFPLYRGFAGVPRHGTKNEVNLTLLNYLARGFCGWRGSIRRKFQICGPNLNYMAKAARDIGSPTYATTWINIGDPSLTEVGVNDRLIDSQPPGWTGESIFNVQTNSGVEVELPYFRPNRFSFARNTHVNNGIGDDMSNKDFMVLNVTIPNYQSGLTTETWQSFHVDDYVAVGDDFSFFFYVGAPLFYTNNN
jgi:hypothetical protein